MAPVELRIAPHVLEARDAGGALVALESTVVTHGLPRPENLELAHRLEAAVRGAGAVPATIGVVAGTLVVGLDADELERLANGDADKASPWNLAAVCARGGDAGTTVATTLHAAARAGASVLATGGIGGVHEVPFDESADLLALSRTPLATVCSGPKSILDASATLERLESHGVPTVGYRSDHLAGFHVRTTDLPLAARADEPDAIAAIIRTQRALQLPAGVLISNPVSEGIAPERMRAWLATAHEHAAAAGVRGKDATPHLLSALAELSGGETVRVNVRLLEENASLAAAIAHALAPGGIGVSV